VDTPTADQELLAPLHDARESHPELAHTACLHEEIVSARRKIEASAPALPVGQQKKQWADGDSPAPTVTRCGRPGQMSAPSALTLRERSAPAILATTRCIAATCLTAAHATRRSSAEGDRLSNVLLPLHGVFAVRTDDSAREEGCR
jgi:hypothetical protein